jgi:hypothetical protein
MRHFLLMNLQHFLNETGPAPSQASIFAKSLTAEILPAATAPRRQRQKLA